MEGVYRVCAPASVLAALKDALNVGMSFVFDTNILPDKPLRVWSKWAVV